MSLWNFVWFFESNELSWSTVLFSVLIWAVLYHLLGWTCNFSVVEDPGVRTGPRLRSSPSSTSKTCMPKLFLQFRPTHCYLTFNSFRFWALQLQNLRPLAGSFKVSLRSTPLSRLSFVSSHFFFRPTTPFPFISLSTHVWCNNHVLCLGVLWELCWAGWAYLSTNIWRIYPSFLFQSLCEFGWIFYWFDLRCLDPKWVSLFSQGFDSPTVGKSICHLGASDDPRVEQIILIECAHLGFYLTSLVPSARLIL